MPFVTGHSILVPYMNSQGPLAGGSYYSNATRPSYVIGSAVRFRWIVPTGSSKVAFDLYMHGVRAAGLAQHELIANINNSTDWTADGTVLLHGITWDIYYKDIVISDSIPGLYSICLNSNGRHFIESTGTKRLITEADGIKYHHDGGFQLTPAAAKHYDALPERTELFTRVAGEKAWYEDEFITGSQLEPGSGISIKYRDSTGTHPDYGTTASKAWNIIIENGLSVGTDVVTGVNLVTGAAVSWGSQSTVSPVGQFLISDEPDWIYDAAMARTSINPGTTWSENSIPVHAQYVESPSGTVHISLRTMHNGLYVSHDDISTVTQKNSGPNGTIGHIQFLDSDCITWDVTEADINGHRGYRPGVIVKANCNVVRPSIRNEWWFTPQLGNEFGDIYTAYWQYFGVRNWINCQNEITISPYGPVDDALDLASNANSGGLKVFSETKWAGPSGAFQLSTGRVGHTQAAASARVGYPYPFMNGAMQVNTPGYYHISTDVHLTLQRVLPLTEQNAWHLPYFGYWGLWLMVYRSDIGVPPENDWHITRLDMEMTEHSNELGIIYPWGIYGPHGEPAQQSLQDQRDLLMSRRVNLQGSKDIWMNEYDKVCLLISGHGRDGGVWSGHYGLNENNSWGAALTHMSFSMHMIHDNEEDVKNDYDHPNSLNQAGQTLDRIDPTWEAPNITRMYIQDHH